MKVASSFFFGLRDRKRDITYHLIHQYACRLQKLAGQYDGQRIPEARTGFDLRPLWKKKKERSFSQGLKRREKETVPKPYLSDQAPRQMAVP